MKEIQDINTPLPNIFFSKFQKMNTIYLLKLSEIDGFKKTKKLILHPKLSELFLFFGLGLRKVQPGRDFLDDRQVLGPDLLFFPTLMSDQLVGILDVVFPRQTVIAILEERVFDSQTYKENNSGQIEPLMIIS
jgi:hypothetical protein